MGLHPPPELDEGDDVVIEQAKVKAHREYNDQDETAVTRAKLTMAAEATVSLRES